MKPFCYFNRDTGWVRFETLRELRQSRTGEQREIPLYTADMVSAVEVAIKQSLGLPIETSKRNGEES